MVPTPETVAGKQVYIDPVPGAVGGIAPPLPVNVCACTGAFSSSKIVIAMSWVNRYILVIEPPLLFVRKTGKLKGRYNEYCIEDSPILFF
jgi:hypothetical protein